MASFVSNMLPLALVSACMIRPILCLGSAPPLKRFGADRNQVSISGLSAGAFMASQVHVAYSSSVMGVGVIAGGPYWCARGILTIALTQCMSTGNIDVDYLVNTATTFAFATDTIDDPGNMDNDKVYIYGGSKDSVVVQDVARTAEEYYAHYVKSDSQIKTEYGIPSEHAMVTNAYGNACGYEGSPYINNCGYNTAFEMLNHFYGGSLQEPTDSTAQNGDFLEFDQAEFFTNDPSRESVADWGYVYVPTGCTGSASHCRVHIALHGCLQQSQEIGDKYARYAGYNEVAELNDVIVIYPQTIKTAISNPNGCWDWWGYHSISYACNLAPQMKFMKAIIDHVVA